MSHSKNALFAEDSDESGTEDKEWKGNNSYAQNYKQWRRKEEIVKLKSRFGEDAELSDDSDSETSDDEFVEPDNPDFDRDFLLTLGALHQKDKKALKDGASFFKNKYVSGNKVQEEKPMTIKDYERHIIMNCDGKFDDDNEEPSFSGSNNTEQVTSGFDDGGVSSEDEEDLLTSGLFKLKKEEQTDQNETEESDGDLLAFVKGEVMTVGDKKEQDLLTGLKEAWTNPNNSNKDKWLADFFLNKRYQDEEDESIERAYNEVIIDEETLSEDEQTVAKMDVFETKYRFRYEEPDQEFIKHHPRSIPDSMRQKDERRKEKREEVKKRKDDDKERKRQEIQQLKALKLQEIQEKIQKIKEVSGNDDIGDQILSDDDFDPDKHDAQMSKFYGEDYYGTNEDGDEKPVFEDDEIYENYDEWLEKEGEGAAGGGKLGEEECTGEDEIYFEDDPNFNMDCDYDPSQESLQEEIKASTSKRKGRKKSKFAKALAKKKPVFNPDEKNFDSYFEEYYKLDFEDLVGGVPCRFKYRKVEANNFGLTTEEILSAKDKELNRWFPVRKMVRYGRSQQEELKDRNNYKNRSSQLHVKQKILPSLFVEDPEEKHIEEEERKRLKNQKKKLKRLEKQKLAELMAQNKESAEEEIAEENQTIDSECKSKKKKKIKHVSVETEHNTQIEEENDEPKRKKKKRDNSIEDNDDNDIVPAKNEVKKELKKKKKKKDISKEGDIMDTNIADFQSQKMTVSEFTPSDLVQQVPINCKSEKKLKKRKKTTNKPFYVKNYQDGLDGISDARLLAYGANPKKIKNKAKYGKKKDMLNL